MQTSEHQGQVLRGDFVKRLIETMEQVLACAVRTGVLERLEDRSGWLALATHDARSPIARLPISTLHVYWALGYDLEVEEQLKWLRSAQQVLTSRAWQTRVDRSAVVIRTRDYYLGYAAACPQDRTEAILVVTAIRLGQFNQILIDRPSQPFRDNPYIKRLLRAAS